MKWSFNDKFFKKNSLNFVHLHHQSKAYSNGNNSTRSSYCHVID